jgi:hypothetical protein
MTAVALAAGIGVLGLLAIVLLGWIVPLTLGIARRRRNQGGRGLLIFGGVWAVVGIGLAAVIVLGVVSSLREMRRYASEEFVAAGYKGPTGHASVSWPGSFNFTLSGAGAKGGALRVQGRNGTALCPAGSFELASVALEEMSSDAAWSAAAYFRKGRPVTIGAGETNALPAGPPFVASVDAEPIRGTNAVFNFRLVDSQGDTWQIRKSGEGARAPGFEVRTPEDVVVWRGNFEYG